MSEHEPTVPRNEAIEAAKLELAAEAEARREQLAKNQAEHQPDGQKDSAERARELINSHQDQPSVAEHQQAPTNHHPLLLDKTLNYKQTLASLQRQLSPASRRLSKVIHQPAIEKTSEVLEQTILRPSIALGATTTAFIVGAFFYLTARHYGFALSGTEIVLSLVIGAMIGLAIEGLINLLHSRVIK